MVCMSCREADAIATLQTVRPSVIPPLVVCNPCLNEYLRVREALVSEGNRFADVLVSRREDAQ